MRAVSVPSLIALALMGLNTTATVAAENPTWEGFYAGLALGTREQKSEWQQTAFTLPNIGATPTAAGYSAHDTNRDDNGYVGLYGGYNWAIDDKVIAGVELAVGYADNQSGKNFIDSTDSFAGFGRPSSSHVSLKTDWDASLRGRLGYLVTPDVLVYGAAGLAATRLSSSTYCPADNTVCNGAALPRKQTDSENLMGWTAGFGVESNLGNNLLARAEYQYVDYGDTSYQAMDMEPFQAIGVRNRVEMSAQKLTLGLAYRF